MKTPIELMLDDKPVAQIISFGYETPWATGIVEFTDQELFKKLVCVSSMASFEMELSRLELEDDEEEDRWERKLAELALTWEDLKLDCDDRWAIIPCGGEPQPIYSLRFDRNGYMDWRF